jgi:hypothetical protein
MHVGGGGGGGRARNETFKKKLQKAMLCDCFQTEFVFSAFWFLREERRKIISLLFP